MPTHNETVQALKNLANLVMSVLTMLLQVSMQMIEGGVSHASDDLTQHLEQMYGQLDQQRTFLQTLINQHQAQASSASVTSSSPSPNPMTKYPKNSPPRSPVIPALPDVQREPSEMGRGHGGNTRPVSSIAGIPIPQGPRPEDSVSVVGGPAMSEVSIGWEMMSATAFTSPGPSSAAGPRPNVVAPSSIRNVTPGNISLHEWGRKVVTWGKKHPGKTFFEVMETDMGYYEWSRKRYNSLPANQQEFVDYGRLKLEIEAES